MKSKITTALLTLMTTAVLISGCGGGGGGSTAAPERKAVVKIATEGALAGGATIGGIDITVTLPPGVTLRPDATDPKQPDNGVVMASGVAVNSTFVANYTPAVGSVNGTVRIGLANGNGFGTGEFITINCDLAATSAPVASDVLISNFTVAGLTTSTTSTGVLTTTTVISSLTTTHTLVIQ